MRKSKLSEKEAIDIAYKFYNDHCDKLEEKHGYCKEKYPRYNVFTARKSEFEHNCWIVICELVENGCVRDIHTIITVYDNGECCFFPTLDSVK